MSLDTLQQAILDQARKEADRLLGEAQERVDEEQQRILQEAQDVEEEIIKNAHKEGKHRAQLMRQETELKGRSNVLAAKQEELSNTKDAYINQLLELDDEEARALLEGLIASLPSKKGTITAGAQHKNILQDILAKHDALELSSDTIQNDGGFVYESDDTRLNLRISHLVDMLFARHRADIARLLFS